MLRYLLISFLLITGCKSSEQIFKTYDYNALFSVSSGQSIFSLFKNDYSDQTITKDLIFTGHDQTSLFFEIREKIQAHNSNNESSISKTPLSILKNPDSIITVLNYKIKVLDVSGGILKFKLKQVPESEESDRLRSFFGYSSELYSADGSLIATGKVVKEDEDFLLIEPLDSSPRKKISKHLIHHIIKSDYIL